MEKMVLIRFISACLLCTLCTGFDGWHCLNNDLECLNDLPRKMLSLLSNKHLLFIGDSLTRYQYISLVYMLRHRTRLLPEMEPNLVLEKQWGSWNDFYRIGNGMLKPYEVCDCFRVAGDFRDIFENRYYHDPNNKISVTYLSLMGTPSSLSQGHLLPDQVNNTGVTDAYPKPYQEYAHWAAWDLPSLITDYVSHLSPKPTIIILNYGKWHPSIKEQEFRSLLEALNLHGFPLIWKTTTFNREGSEDPLISAENEKYHMAKQRIMDTSWTKQVNTTYYWDEIHFTEPIYSILNSQLLEVLS